MDTRKLRSAYIRVSHVGPLATISLTGSFCYSSHVIFRETYNRILNIEAINEIEIDCSEIEYLDSAALGMLLVLKDKADFAHKMLVLSRPSQVALSTFELVGFQFSFHIH